MPRKKAPAEEQGPQQRARVKLRRWVRERLDSRALDGRLMPEVSREALTWLQAEDPKLAAQLLTEAYASVVYHIVQEVTSATRTTVFVAGGRVVPRAEIGQRAVAFRSKWQSWVEYHRVRGVKLLMEMTKAELVEAAAVRERRADAELELAWVFRTMASQMHPRQKVKNRFTPEQIDDLRAQAKAPEAMTA